MQTPQSTSARKHRSLESPKSPGSPGSPASFFAELSAAAATEKKAAAASAGKPSRPRGRDPEAADAPKRAKGADGVGAGSVTDRRVESRRAEDAPASNRPARAWVRPAWMTQERIESLLDAQPQGANGSGRIAEGSEGQAAPLERGTGGAGLAHDASNLLAALMLYSELLSLPEVLPERHRHYAEDLKLLAERSRALIDRLVSFGGAVDRERGSDKGQGSLQVSLVDVVVRCEGLLSTLARGALQVSFGAQAALPVAIAPESLERILVNLVKNAAQATRDGGAVRIGVGLCPSGEGAPPAGGASGAGIPLAPPRYRSAARPQGRGPGARANPRSAARRMLLTVDDSGCGMSEQQIARILGSGAAPALTQECSAAAAAFPQRQGIGLRVVRELVAASGGKLAITSRAGVGTRIEIEWPVAEAETPRANAEANAPAGLHPEPNPMPEERPGTDFALPGTVPRMEMVADPAAALGDLAELAGFAGGLSEAEQRLLTQPTGRAGKRAASADAAERNGQFQGFNHDSKGAIAC